MSNIKMINKRESIIFTVASAILVYNNDLQFP